MAHCHLSKDYNVMKYMNHRLQIETGSAYFHLPATLQTQRYIYIYIYPKSFKRMVHTLLFKSFLFALPNKITHLFWNYFQNIAMQVIWWTFLYFNRSQYISQKNRISRCQFFPVSCSPSPCQFWEMKLQEIPILSGKGRLLSCDGRSVIPEDATPDGSHKSSMFSSLIGWTSSLPALSQGLNAL